MGLIRHLTQLPPLFTPRKKKRLKGVAAEETSGHQVASASLGPNWQRLSFFPNLQISERTLWAQRELIAGPLIEVDGAEIVKGQWRSQPKPTSRDEDETNGRTSSLEEKACGMRLPCK